MFCICQGGAKRKTALLRNKKGLGSHAPVRIQGAEIGLNCIQWIGYPDLIDLSTRGYQQLSQIQEAVRWIPPSIAPSARPLEGSARLNALLSNPEQPQPQPQPESEEL